MAAYTSTQAGNWSDPATWGGSGPPGAGDTASVAHAVTVAADTTVGSSPATGGTAALAVTANTLTVAAGKALTVLGPIAQTSPGFTTISRVVLAAGASVAIRPASGQKYTWSFAEQAQLVCNGTSGAHCTIATDLSLGGLPAYMTSSGQNRTQGVVTAAYCDFSDFGDSSHFGVGTYLGYPDDTSQPVSIANCTFARCSITIAEDDVWDGIVAFSDNAMSSGVISNGNNATALISIQTAVTSGSRSFSGNTFDGLLQAQYMPGASWQYNVFRDGVLFPNVPSAPSLLFDSNLYRLAGAASNAGGLATPGSVTNCYMLADAPSGFPNPHMLAQPTFTGAASFDFTGNVFEFNGTDASGNMLLIGSSPAAAQSFKVSGNIFVPNAAGQNSGAAMTTFDNISNISITFEHNTTCVEGQLGLELGHAQTVVESPNRWASMKSNLFYGSTSTGTICTDIDGIGLVDLIPPVVADYNAKHLVALTEPQPSYTNQGGGYCAKWSVTPGAHDLTADPMFVDAARNLATYGATAGQSGYAATLAYISAAPRTRIPALLAHVRAGFRPTNPALAGATYPGDTATTDAAGNALAGTIGAMAYQAAATAARNSCLLGVGS